MQKHLHIHISQNYTEALQSKLKEETRKSYAATLTLTLLMKN